MKKLINFLGAMALGGLLTLITVMIMLAKAGVITPYEVVQEHEYVLTDNGVEVREWSETEKIAQEIEILVDKTLVIPFINK